MSSQRTNTPGKADGRNIDPAGGTLEGEGSLQRVRSFVHEDRHADGLRAPVTSVALDRSAPTYYGQPMLKPTVWKWSVPTYFYIGGVAGATSALRAATLLWGGGRFPTFARAARWVGMVGDVVSGVLLIEDLGRPERFLNMMRVFRPTSPMNLGTWILSGSGALNTAGLLFADRTGWLGRMGRGAEVGAGVLGLGLTGYTGVLLANTAVPVWQGACLSLPPLFVSASAASAGSLFQLLPVADEERTLLRRFSIAGQVGVLASSWMLEREVGRSPEAARPLREGVSGALWKASKLLTAASLILSLLPGDRKGKRVAAAVLGTAGSLAMRFGIFQAGRSSARSPRDSFGQQRAGLGANAVMGLSAVTGPGERAVVGQPVVAYRLPVIR